MKNKINYPGKSISRSIYLLMGLLLAVLPIRIAGCDLFIPEDVIKIKTASSAAISPDGKYIAYIVRIPRTVEDESGGSYGELYVVSTVNGKVRPFITGKVNISTPQWSPDGKTIAFLTARDGKSKTQVWAIPVDGGEARQITDSPTNVSSFRWHPSSEKIAFIAASPETKKEKALKKKGFDFIYYEENLKHRNIFLLDLKGNLPGAGEQLTKGITTWSLEFSPDGKTIAAVCSPENLIDQSYMFRKVYLIDIESRKMTGLTDNPGKLGNYLFSPDGSKIAYTAALARKDHAVSQVYVMDIKSGKTINLTEPQFRGHVEWAGWRDNDTVAYYAGEGVYPTLSTIKASGGKRKLILNSAESGIIFSEPDFTKDFKHFAFTASTPTVPGDLYYWSPGGKIKRMTDLNPWIADKILGKQDVIKYKARDGQEIEGLIIYPVDYKSGNRYPLIVVVHGGPESHYSNGWMTRYANPAQVQAGRGYAIFFPNYRASTGYGIKFAVAGYMDPAGVEFDDIADGIDHLVNIGIADKDRVALGGGSYGGYAAAWFSSYYTEKVKAVMMFVGISDLISKRNTTDIPYEELYVHSGKPLEEMWDLSLKRSPVYYAHQSKTAVLIAGGADDTRVHPGQSIEYYRILKMNNHPAVRLVQYPGEGHGNRKIQGQIDLMHRQIQWFDWYVKDDKPIDGEMPPLDISDSYGIKLDD